MPVPEALVAALSDRYHIDREAGQGGMATVYLATDLKHQRRVAIKVLRPDLALAIGPRFLREIEVIARLNHPHVIPLFDSGQAGEFIYYVMPYIEGESLRARMQRDPQFSIEEAVRLTHDVAGALAHAHERGLVHRDIKPENILLTEGIALVADFGISRTIADMTLIGPTQLATGMGAILGTPQYMSPEQASGDEVDARSDIYALACVLYEMLAGRPPFVAATASELLRLHLVAEPPDITALRASISSKLAFVIDKALAKVPADRYPNVAQFSEAIALAMAGGTTPVSPPSTIPSHLPRFRTRFIGREKEINEGLRHLSENRMLTLTGIGGSGKTRLALEIAERAIGNYPHGVWFVDLAPLGDGNLVPEAVAARLGVKEVPGKSLTEVLADHVAGKRLLLLLDNCEHMLDAVALLADTLLGAGQQMSILATSREGLGVDGEQQMALRSLATPSEKDLPSVSASDAVKLFVDRARLAAEAFVLTEGNAPGVADICRRLDGIPLAIELAAARVKILSVDQILRKLDDRFRLLVGSRKTALPRHQTLQTTLQWSYDLLTAEEQELFRSLSVFSGGWTLETAARLHGDLDEMEVMERLGRLIDKSLVVVEREEAPRYSFLETVRQYGQERLVESGESTELHRRHLEMFLELAERAYAERFVREEIWSNRLESEHDNLRAAIERARESDPEIYLQLVGTLAWFFQARSHFLEGRAHLTAAMAVTTALPPRPARARALWGMANTLSWQGEGRAALPWMQDALQMWRALEDRREVALALEGIGWAELLAGDDAKACGTFEESLALFRELGDRYLVNRAMVALGQTLVALHRVEEARSMAKEIIAFSSVHGDKRSEHFGWHYLADCALIQGECEESLRLYRQSLALAQALGDKLETSFEVQGVGMSLAGLGQPEGALRLVAAAQAEWERLGVDVHMRFWDELLERYLGRAREALGPERAAAAHASGRQMGFQEVVKNAMDA